MEDDAPVFLLLLLEVRHVVLTATATDDTAPGNRHITADHQLTLLRQMPIYTHDDPKLSYSSNL